MTPACARRGEARDAGVASSVRTMPRMVRSKAHDSAAATGKPRPSSTTTGVSQASGRCSPRRMGSVTWSTAKAKTP